MWIVLLFAGAAAAGAPPTKLLAAVTVGLRSSHAAANNWRHRGAATRPSGR